MSTDIRKHTSIAAGEAPSRAALAASLLSMSDVVPVANVTEANQVAAALIAAGQNLANTPLTVRRADAPGMHQLEVTTDGTNWAPVSSVQHFANDTARDSWTTANSSKLSAGDRCVSNSVEQRYRYGGWVPVDPVYAIMTSPAQSGITTATAVTGLSLTIVLPGTSNLRARIELAHYATNVDTAVTVNLKDGATVVSAWSRMANSSTTTASTTVVESFDTILTGVSSGSHTYTVELVRGFGTGTIGTSPSTTTPQFLSVEVI